ncbi:MAG: sugar phosphate isomerase/epimerase family protein [Sediminicola sp.]|tara:strand:- start:24364 stop:25350 length:987 start_codon:yes stop_codon:yes gene_type:complete
MKKSNLFKIAALSGAAVLLMLTESCKDAKKAETATPVETETVAATAEPFFELSLAQWSLHKMILDDGVDPYSFAEKAKGWGFDGLEYVSQLYKDLEKADYSPESMAAFVEKCNAESKKHGLKNVLIMVDRQGDLATSNASDRKKAVENHYKWVDAAAAMGCTSIRVNLNGSDDAEQWTANAVDGLTQLATYAKEKNINVIVENHGGLSSDGAKLAAVMEKVGMENCGTLPDFGNFCITREANGCAEEYDKYKGIKELMPYAKGVSAKSHDFDSEGNETDIDYVRVLQLVKDAGYDGYIGVEYEGSVLGEEAGILATKELLLKAAKEVE